MLKGFHVAPSFKVITHTQATINRKEKNFIRPNKVHPHGSRTIMQNTNYSIKFYQNVFKVLLVLPYCHWNGVYLWLRNTLHSRGQHNTATDNKYMIECGDWWASFALLLWEILISRKSCEPESFLEEPIRELNRRLTHWGRVTHICVSIPTILGSDNGLSPGRRQAIICTNEWILLIGPLSTNFSEILIKILTFSFKKMHMKVSSAKRWPFCLGLNVLKTSSLPKEVSIDFVQSFALCDIA